MLACHKRGMDTILCTSVQSNAPDEFGESFSPLVTPYLDSSLFCFKWIELCSVVTRPLNSGACVCVLTDVCLSLLWVLLSLRHEDAMRLSVYIGASYCTTTCWFLHSLSPLASLSLYFLTSSVFFFWLLPCFCLCLSSFMSVSVLGQNKK